MRNGAYPVIITAHPVARMDDWLNRFERWVRPFAKQTLSEYVKTSFDVIPVTSARSAEIPTPESVSL